MQFNQQFDEYEHIQIDHYSKKLVPIDLQEQYEKGNLVVSGSESYNADQYTPVEAINDLTGPGNKFGGEKRED